MEWESDVTMANKSYDDEFKRNLVRLHLEQGRTLSSLSKEYGPNSGTIRSWVDLHRKECFKDNNKIPDSAYKELQKLRKEAEELRKENEFLKKAAAFFAKEIKN